MNFRRSSDKVLPLINQSRLIFQSINLWRSFRSRFALIAIQPFFAINFIAVEDLPVTSFRGLVFNNNFISVKTFWLQNAGFSIQRVTICVDKPDKELHNLWLKVFRKFLSNIFFHRITELNQMMNLKKEPHKYEVDENSSLLFPRIFCFDEKWFRLFRKKKGENTNLQFYGSPKWIFMQSEVTKEARRRMERWLAQRAMARRAWHFVGIFMKLSDVDLPPP